MVFNRFIKNNVYAIILENLWSFKKTNTISGDKI